MKALGKYSNRLVSCDIDQSICFSNLLTMSEKLCLQWNDFQDNVKSAFKNLRESTNFADVTLACEDGHQIEAHRVVLAASSPFFQGILKRNKHSHPLIFMRGIKSVDLVAMVDFLYFGEANVYQENLDSFLAIAEELQLKGLQGSNDQQHELNDIELNTKSLPTNPKQKYGTNQMVSDRRRATKENKSTVSKEQMDEVRTDENNVLAIPLSADFQQMDETVKSMMEPSQNLMQNGKRQVYGKTCKVCGKEGLPSNIMRHIEANHLEGVSIPCNHCDKFFKSRHGLREHVSQYHKQQ